MTAAWSPTVIDGAVGGVGLRFVNATIEAIGRSINAYAAERGRPVPPPLGGA